MLNAKIFKTFDENEWKPTNMLLILISGNGRTQKLGSLISFLSILLQMFDRIPHHHYGL